MSGIRDYLLLVTLVGLVPISLARPWIGTLGWFWIAYMVPHSLTWGFGRSLPLAAMVGGATLLGFLFTKDRRPLPRSWTVVFVILFMIHITLSTALSFNSELAWPKWNWVTKVFVMTLVALCLFQDRVRLRYLYMVPALGLGFYGFKSGLWVFRTGGGDRLWGPDRSFFADNNTFGLALAMVLPLLLYLSREESRRWLRVLLKTMFGLTIVAIIFTYSRGAFLALLVVVGILIWRSPWRLGFGVAAVAIALVAAPLAPSQLKARMGSISDQESAETRDTSAAGRIEAWHTAWGVAVSHPVFGEGFKALWNTEIWNTYFGNDYLAVRDVHSLYFEVLSEHGFGGFAIYMAILGSTLYTLRRLRKRWRDDVAHGYLSRYAEMTEIGVYAYLVAGTFLGVAYFDLYFLLVATGILLGQLSQEAEATMLASNPTRDEVRSRVSRLSIPVGQPARSRTRHA